VTAPQTTDLWKSSLGLPANDPEADAFRDGLVAAWEKMRGRCATLAGEIARDLPEYTVHDGSHSDALWGLASRIGGPGLELNPVEGFVFGAAVLVHDLGMASAAYIDGPEALRSSMRWSDTVAAILRQDGGSAPTPEELADPGPAVVSEATGRMLRDLHAEHAEALVKAGWEGSGGNRYSLLEDADLRDALGRVIGRVAHSHWWPVRRLDEEFAADMGAPPGAPPEWTVRPLVLACLLRLADACHLDGSRAPRFLRLLRSPKEGSAPHWTFQSHLAQPLLREDRIAFTGTPFTADEVDAWWLCAEALEAADRECRRVDSLLADRKHQRFAVRGVAGAEDFAALAELIPTEGWSPIDARIRVSNVIRLVDRLGGKELYGSRPEIPLRELIQNGCDAVRARRILDEIDADAGVIRVRLSEELEDGRRWLEVEDSGVGMSREVLCDHLLDFGDSFWESGKVIEQFPGLLSGGFSPTGRFGIGFFSVFMWGGSVDVVSRRYEAARADTHVLEFRGGLGNRPVLRVAEKSEQMADAGTRVRALLEPYALRRLGLGAQSDLAEGLHRLCGWLAPALDVDLEVAVGGSVRRAISAGDWLTVPMRELAERVGDSPLRSDGYLEIEDSAPEKEEEPEGGEEDPDAVRQREAWVAERLADADLIDEVARPLVDADGVYFGRLAALTLRSPGPWRDVSAATAVGGLRAADLPHLTGVLVGDPTTAARNLAVPLVPADLLAAWASEQARLLGGLSGPRATRVAEIVWVCGGETGDLPVASGRDGDLSLSALEAWLAERDEIVVVQDAAVNTIESQFGPVELGDGVLAVAMVRPAFHSSLVSDAGQDMQAWPEVREGGNYYAGAALMGVVAEAIERVWAVAAQEVWSMYYDISDREIGQRGGEPVLLSASRFSRGTEAPG
jgi:hypothetical protein